MTTAPTIICTREGDAFVFHCPYCKRKHRHSAEDGHRVAHCHDRQSPYHATGYVLRERTNLKATR